MTPESEHTLIWLGQTLFVGVLIVMLGGAFGNDYLMYDLGYESGSLQRIVLALLFATGSVFFLFWNVSQLIDTKIDSSAADPSLNSDTNDSLK